MGAGQHVLRPLGAGEGISWNASDVAVVADDAGQGDGAQVCPLGGAEHTFPLPPKPPWGGEKSKFAPGTSRI